MPKICFLLNSVPDTWVNFFPSPENFNSLLQDELSNSSPHAVQPSLCLPWLCGTSCIRNLPFFPNRPCLILPSCPGLFCFPFFEGLLFSLWLCKVYRHSRPHTHGVTSFPDFPKEHFSYTSPIHQVVQQMLIEDHLCTRRCAEADKVPGLMNASSRWEEIAFRVPFLEAGKALCLFIHLPSTSCYT